MILRLLEEGMVTRVGSTKARPISVRVIGATNRNLDEMMDTGGFRKDLYYRIASWVCLLPPLRERREDISHLAAHFMSMVRPNGGRRQTRISPEALEALVGFHWPGNIRQLKNEICRAIAVAPDHDVIEKEHLSPWLRRGPSVSKNGTLRERLQLTEKLILEREIDAVSGDVTAVASRLDIPLSTLYRRLKVLGIARR
jgi:transcriptional regulator with PAS, ATPase and Fis domain